MSEQPTLDPKVLGDFAEMLGADGPAVVDELIDTYLDDTPKRIADVDEATGARDLERLRRAAHTLKSSSASVGALKLSQMSATLERVTYEDPDAAFDAACASALRGELDRVQRELEALRTHQSVDQGNVGAHRVLA
ncbi:MAG: Hpt domain-containing protein [Myxococcales bacterium]|nr:Hpt domain-containing protein [Myxococcales bacterium]